MYNEGDYVVIRVARIKAGENAKIKTKYKGLHTWSPNRSEITDM